MMNKHSNLSIPKRLGRTLILSACIALASCSPQSSSAPESEASSQSSSLNPPEPTWEALDELHHLTDEAHELAEAGSVGELRTLAPELRDHALAVALEEPPSFVVEPLTVKVLLPDLASLAEELKDVSALSDEEILTMSGSFHPLLEQIMEAAGLSHDHGHDHDHDHEHGHSHDHDH